MWELAYKGSWALKNWCFWTVVLEKTLESSLDCKEIQRVHPKGSQSWILIGRTDDEDEAPTLWSPDAKNCLIGKDPDAWEDWGQEDKGMTEGEMAGCHHWLNEHEFEWAPRIGDGHESLAFCSLWGHRIRHDWATELNWLSGPRKVPSLGLSFPIFNLFQPQGLSKWLTSSHQVAKVLKFQLHHQSFQWIFRTDFL